MKRIEAHRDYDEPIFVNVTPEELAQAVLNIPPKKLCDWEFMEPSLKRSKGGRGEWEKAKLN